MYLNIQGTINNFAEIETNINENIDFICLVETHLKSEDENALIEINNFNIFRCDSESRHTGGVMFYVRQSWKTDIIRCIAVNLDIWMLVIRVKKDNNTFYLGGIYRSPRYMGINNEFYDKFNNLIEDVYELDNDIILMGDFNIDWIKISNQLDKCKQILNDHGFKQVVDSYTRITGDSKTLIDWVIINQYNNSIKVKIDENLKISDHETIRILFDKESIINNKKKIRILKYDKQRLRNKICRSDIMTTYYVHVNEKAKIFSKNLQDIVKEFITETEINNKENAWFTNDLRILKSEKIEIYKRAKWTNNNEEWIKYREIRNKYKNRINLSKNKYICDKIENSYNQKMMWKNIKNLVIKKPINDINEVIFEKGKVDDKKTIANELNKYFIESIDKINNSIDNVQYVNYVSNNNYVFKFSQINIEALLNVIKSMNDKKDRNLINRNIFIDAFELIGHNLVTIMNDSMSSGVYPETWKESLVVPVQKTKNAKKAQDFRPVNTIITEAKILEKIVHEQIVKYFENNDIISERQSGFRKMHSCESLINLVITNWKMAIDENKCVVAVFLDLRRAFETIDKNILIQKLQKYGIMGNELNWFKSYLNGRIQKTKVNDVISETIEVKLGVPQGSILGVLLFLIYINDIEKIINKCEIVLFADDALIYYIGENANECVQQVNQDLNDLSYWFKMNKLKLNIDKTKGMIINGITESIIKIDNDEIEIVNEIKYLGIIIDNKLKFHKNIDYICRKVAKKIGFMRRIRQKISMKCAIQIYNTMVKPHFEYCSSVIYMCNNEEKTRLQKLQNKAMRVILKLNRFASGSAMLETLKWMNIEKKIKMNVLIIIFKIKNNLYPKYLSDKLLYGNDIHHYRLRNIFNFRLNYFRKEKTKNMMMYKGLKLYNTLPVNIKQESNLRKFKHLIKDYI